MFQKNTSFVLSLGHDDKSGRIATLIYVVASQTKVGRGGGRGRQLHLSYRVRSPLARSHTCSFTNNAIPNLLSSGPPFDYGVIAESQSEQHRMSGETWGAHPQGIK